MLEIADEDAFPHQEITRKIIGAAFEVHNQLGYGFLGRVSPRHAGRALAAGGSALN